MADESTKPKRVTLTVILGTEEDRQLKRWMELELAQRRYAGTVPRDMTLSEFALQLLRSQRATYQTPAPTTPRKRK